ncbi:hypothetical protein GGI35DRAFT_477536 [Trichoderma velutinum]
MAGSEVITFGWELELIVHLQKGEPPGLEFQDDKLRELALSIKGQVPNLPVAAQCSHHQSKICCICKDAPPEFCSFALRVFTPAVPILEPENNSEDLYFHVKRELLDVPHDQYCRRLAHGFEITSPILDNEELKTGLPQTAQIVSAIRNSHLSISAHEKCGLHIHVGVKNGMTLSIAKKAVTLAMLLEQSLFTKFSSTARAGIPTWFCHIGSRCRFATKAKKECYYITKDNTSGQLLEHLPMTPSELKPAEWNDNNPNKWYLTLNYIWRTDSIWRLSTGLQTYIGAKVSLALCTRTKGGKYAYENDASNHDGTDRLEGSPTTIEFRYPPMSFDTEFIKNWVEISCRVVEIATRDTLSFSQVAAGLLQELQRDEKQSDLPKWARLLTILGLGHQIDFWKQQLQRFEAGEIIRFLDSDGFVLPDN